MIVTTLLAAALATAPTPASRQESGDIAPLLDHASLTGALQRLAASSDRAELVEVGRSRAGRVIHALRVGAPDVDDAPARPAVLVVAGLEGPDTWTSSLATAEARDLVASIRGDDAALLERATFWFVPRANPDACEARFASPLAEVRGTGAGVDDDRDGQSGEDGPADVDGDGLVTMMRWEDPEGEWIEDPTEPRAMVRAEREKGERGRWKLAREARDADGDEEYGEDPAHDVDVNRNFPQGFEQHTARAGSFATSEPESRALCDFVIAHPELAMVVCYGELDSLAHEAKTAEGGRGSSRIPPREVLEDDGGLLAELGRRYKDVTGNETKGEDDDAGTFQAWCYHHRGLWTLSIRPWAVPAEEVQPEAEEGDAAEAEEGGEAAASEAPASRPADEGPDAGPRRGRRGGPSGGAGDDEPKPSDDALRLAQLDALGEGERFVPWRAFEHPELGPVEIGGFRPYALTEPPDETRSELAEKEGAFLRTLPEVLARAEIVEPRAEVLEGGLLEITCALENDALLPLSSAAARRARTIRPARVELVLPDGATRLAGPAVELVRELAGSGGRHELRWLVRGADPSRISITLDTQCAGRDQAAPEVER